MRLRFLSGAGLIAVAAILGGGTSEPAKKRPTSKPLTAADRQKARAAKRAAAARVKANELGQIPVLMFHRVIDKPGTTDDRTPAQFRSDLERLVQDGYVPITAAEYVTGKIDIPAGKHAVVLT